MSAKTRVLVCDDHELFRDGVKAILRDEPSIEVTGEARDGREAVDLALRLKPDVVLMDLEMPALNGIEVTRRIHQAEPRVRVLMLTMYGEEDMFNAAMDLGVKAYVVKESAADDILAALERVYQGETFISPALSDIGKRRTHRVQQLLLSKPQIEDLTSAERRILKFIAEDRTSKEIADLLKISVKTVENHRLNMCHKLNLHGSHSLLKFAFEVKAYL